jgi:PAS domain S-box-containing protein
VKKDLRILVLEDVATDVVLINHEFRRSGIAFCTKRVETREDFLRELDQNPPDVILSDHGLPSFDGFTALAIAQDKCPDTPFIFVTSSMGEEVAVESLRSGASDYVLKSRLTNLVPVVQRALRLADERTRRKHAEKELRESEERFRMLVSGVKDYGIFMLDPEGRVSSWNVGAEWITGYRANEILHQDFACFYRQEDIERGKPQADLKAAVASGRLEEEGWRVRKGGTEFRAHVAITPLFDEQGRQRGFTHVTRDVTERRQTQELLQKSEERYRQLVELCPDALLVIAEEQIVFANTAAHRLLGVADPEQLLGKPVDDFVQLESREAFHRHLRELPPEDSVTDTRKASAVLQLRAITFSEVVFQRPDGSRVFVEVAGTRLTFQDEPAIQLIAHDITDRKAAAAELRESEARKTAIFEASLEAIVCVDQSGTVREWNAAAERIFGYPREEALGQRLDNLIVPTALRERYLHGLTDYLMTGVGSLIGRPIELVARRQNGAEFPIELAITAVNSSEPPMFTAFIRDITERKRIEDALRQSEARKAAVVATALDAIVSIDHEGKIIEWNPAAEKIFGYSRALALGRNMAELIMPRSAVEAHRAGFTRFLTSGRDRMLGQRTETAAMRANGAEFPVEVTVTRIPGDEPPTYTAYIRDITERKRTEEALRKSEERFRLLVDGIDDYAIYMLDIHGRVITWNSGAERIEGYRSNEIIGRRFTRFYTPEDIARRKPEQALAVATAEGRFRDEAWSVRKDGSRYYASVVVTALRDEQGKLYGFSKISRDITKRHEAEQEARRLQSKLESSVKDRTAELQAAYQEMEAFSYSISHDLRAPLIHIGGFVEILQSEAASQLDEKSRQYLSTIAESTRQMGRMIDDLLAFSRMSRAELHKMRVSTADIVRNVLQDLQSETANRRIAWNIHDLPEVSGDPSLLRQVVYNLIANALKYTRTRDEARIEIGSTANDHETVFYVRDNGVGFDMKYVHKLFGVFQRLHSTAEFEGTGIGLANVRRIVQRHGGRAWAEGAVEAGATFYFSIPDDPGEP